MKLSKIDFPLECFGADFLQFPGAIVKIFISGGRLGKHFSDFRRPQLMRRKKMLYL